MTRKRKRSQKKPQKSLEEMTNKRIASMIILDSDPKNHTIRLLQDPETGFYVIFCGKYNQTCYCKSYQRAEKHYNYWVSVS